MIGVLLALVFFVGAVLAARWSGMCEGYEIGWDAAKRSDAACAHVVDDGVRAIAVVDRSRQR